MKLSFGCNGKTSGVLYLEAILFLMSVNPLPHLPIFRSSSSAANKAMMAKIWTNGDTINCLSRKHCGKRKNCSLEAISFFPQCFQKQSVADVLK